MLIDTHVHVGQFENQYFAPSSVKRLMKQVNVDYYAVSSTSMCEENYEKVLLELHTLIQIDQDKVLPVMWITPEGLKGNIAWFLESDIKWRCLKIHPELHPNEWKPQSGQLEEVVDIAFELSIPLLIHSGNDSCSLCGRFEYLIAQNFNVIFIIAHGRPHSDALRLAKMYPNVYIDSAFMTIDNMMDYVNNKLEHKLLWGTDVCIPQLFYPKIGLVDYYSNKLFALRQKCNLEQFENITYKNAIKVFRLCNDS